MTKKPRNTTDSDSNQDYANREWSHRETRSVEHGGHPKYPGNIKKNKKNKKKSSDSESEKSEHSEDSESDQYDKIAELRRQKHLKSIEDEKIKKEAEKQQEESRREKEREKPKIKRNNNHESEEIDFEKSKKSSKSSKNFDAIAEDREWRKDRDLLDEQADENHSDGEENDEQSKSKPSTVIIKPIEKRPFDPCFWDHVNMELRHEEMKRGFGFCAEMKRRKDTAEEAGAHNADDEDGKIYALKGDTFSFIGYKWKVISQYCPLPVSIPLSVTSNPNLDNAYFQNVVSCEVCDPEPTGYGYKDRIRNTFVFDEHCRFWHTGKQDNFFFLSAEDKRLRLTSLSLHDAIAIKLTRSLKNDQNFLKVNPINGDSMDIPNEADGHYVAQISQEAFMFEKHIIEFKINSKKGKTQIAMKKAFIVNSGKDVKIAKASPKKKAAPKKASQKKEKKEKKGCKFIDDEAEVDDDEEAGEDEEENEDDRNFIADEDESDSESTGKRRPGRPPVKAEIAENKVVDFMERHFEFFLTRKLPLDAKEHAVATNEKPSVFIKKLIDAVENPLKTIVSTIGKVSSMEKFHFASDTIGTALQAEHSTRMEKKCFRNDIKRRKSVIAKKYDGMDESKFEATIESDILYQNMFVNFMLFNVAAFRRLKQYYEKVLKEEKQEFDRKRKRSKVESESEAEEAEEEGEEEEEEEQREEEEEEEERPKKKSKKLERKSNHGSDSESE